jgi:hypothetical protein
MRFLLVPLADYEMVLLKEISKRISVRGKKE